MNTTTNRETWLNNLATMMAPKFEELGFPLPAFRVSIGFTGGGMRSRANGECWHASASADRRFEILIRPDMADPVDVAAILAHELTHAAVGFAHKHGGDFAKVMAKLGMSRPFTSSVPGEAFKSWVAPFLEQLGALPHAPLMFRQGAQRGEGGEGADVEGDEGGAEGGSSNAKKKQSTRLLKAACTHDGCGYTVRLSKKWALKLGAVCPEHGAMDIEGLEDCEPEDADAGE